MMRVLGNLNEACGVNVKSCIQCGRPKQLALTSNVAMCSVGADVAPNRMELISRETLTEFGDFNDASMNENASQMESSSPNDLHDLFSSPFITHMTSCTYLAASLVARSAASIVLHRLMLTPDALSCSPPTICDVLASGKHSSALSRS
jgi:hypothetical protein